MNHPHQPELVTRPQADRDNILLEGQKRALELADSGAPLADVLAVLVRTLESQSCEEVLASILILDPVARRLRHGAAPSLPEAYNAAIDGLLIGPQVGSCGTAAFTGLLVVAEDLDTDPLWADFRDLTRQHGLRSCWSLPIESSEGQVLGTFALYHRQPRLPSARDLEVVETLAHTAALVMERAL